MRREIAVSRRAVTGIVARLAAACVLALACAATAAARQSSSISGRVTDARGAAGRGRDRHALRARDGGAAPRHRDRRGGRVPLRAPRAGRVSRRSRGARVRARRRARGHNRARRGGASTLDIALEVAGVSAEVVVTASDSPQPVDEVSKAVNVIGREELDERDEFSIPEALRTVPGLRVRRLGGPGSLTTIRTRGLRNEDTAVLVDGLRLRDPSAPQGDASSLIGDLVDDRREPRRSAARLRLLALRHERRRRRHQRHHGRGRRPLARQPSGRRRLRSDSSAVARRSRAAQARQTASPTARASRTSTSRAASTATTPHATRARRAAPPSGSRPPSRSRAAPTSPIRSRRRTTTRSPSARTTGDITDAVALSREELRRYESGTPIDQLDLGAANFIPSTNNPDARQQGRFFSGALVFTHRLGEDAAYAVSYQGLDITRANFDGAAGTRFDFDGRTHTLNARADFRLGSSNHVTAGYEFESEDFFNRLFFGDPSLDSGAGATERSHALFVQDQLRLFDDRLQLSAAFRAQFFRLDEARFEPAGSDLFEGPFDAPPAAYTGDGSVAYLFRSTATKLRAHVGNGYRAPSLFERFGASFFFGSFFPFGNPDLGPSAPSPSTRASTSRSAQPPAPLGDLLLHAASGDHRLRHPLPQRGRRTRARRRAERRGRADGDDRPLRLLHAHQQRPAHAADRGHHQHLRRPRPPVLRRPHAAPRSPPLPQLRPRGVEHAPRARLRPRHLHQPRLPLRRAVQGRPRRELPAPARRSARAAALRARREPLRPRLLRRRLPHARRRRARGRGVQLLRRGRILRAETTLVEGEDFYTEGPALVFTARYHLRRGYCCENGCRHCPYRVADGGALREDERDAVEKHSG